MNYYYLIFPLTLQCMTFPEDPMLFLPIHYVPYTTCDERLILYKLNFQLTLQELNYDPPITCRLECLESLPTMREMLVILSNSFAHKCRLDGPTQML